MNDHWHFPLACLFVFTQLVHSDAHPAYGIVVDEKRNIYFADIQNNAGSIWRLSSEGTLTLLLDHFHAHNIAIDEDGNVISAHGEENHTMVRIHPDGMIDTLIHTFDMEEFFGGNATWSSHWGIIYNPVESRKLAIIDHRGIKRYIGEHEFQWNQAIYCDPEGVIYAPDIGIDNGALVKIAPDGSTTIIARDLISKLERPRDKHNDVLLGITRGCDNLIYIAEKAGKRIIRIYNDGTSETFYTSDGDWFPTGIDFFAGDAYILESRHSDSGLEGPKIVKVDESGRKSEIFNYHTYRKSEISPPVKGKGNFLLPLGIVLLAAILIILGLRYTEYKIPSGA